MNYIAPRAEPLIREIPLSRLALAPENVRKTPPDPRADAELKASITALGLLPNALLTGSTSLLSVPARQISTQSRKSTLDRHTAHCQWGFYGLLDGRRRRISVLRPISSWR